MLAPHLVTPNCWSDPAGLLACEQPPKPITGTIVIYPLVRLHTNGSDAPCSFVDVFLYSPPWDLCLPPSSYRFLRLMIPMARLQLELPMAS